MDKNRNQKNGVSVTEISIQGYLHLKKKQTRERVNSLWSNSHPPSSVISVGRSCFVLQRQPGFWVLAACVREKSRSLWHFSRKENYRKSRVPYLGVFPKDSSALDALCALPKNGLLLKMSRPNFISPNQDRVSYSCRARERGRTSAHQS